MNKSVILAFLTVLVSCTALLGSCRSRNSSKAAEDFSEYLGISYSDIVSFIVQGYQCHWDGMAPSDMELSPVYAKESVFGGSCQTDIDGDGTPELLLGEQFEDGSYNIYDVFDFDCKTGDTSHTFCGGEDNTFKVNDYYIKLDPFVRYVAPTAFVALKDGQIIGQLYKTIDDTCWIVAQDTVKMSKDCVNVELWSAWDGKGVVFLKDPGRAKVYSEPDCGSPVTGEALYEQGYCPEPYECLGYLPGWFRIRLAEGEGYLPESVAEWDFADRN